MAEKIRVLRILNRFNLGGPTYNASQLTKHMEDDYETLLIGGPNEKNEHDSLHIPHSLGIEPVIVESMRRSMNPVLDRNAYRDVKKIIAKFKPHIVHTHASKAGAVGRSAAFNLKVPVIVHTYHGHVFEAYFNSLISSFYKAVERNLAKKTDAIIALSERQRIDLVKRFRICSEEKTHVIANGFDLSSFQENADEKRKHFRKRFHLSDDEIAIGIIGRMVPVKNHAMFVDVVERVSQLYNGKVRYFIVGDGETSDATRQRFQQKSIRFTDKQEQGALVHFTSWQKKVDEIMAGIDILALTSLNEGTPVCLIEAQAASCPVVSTDVGGIRDIVIEGQTALLSPSQDVETMSRNIVKMITDKKLYISMKLHGWEFVRDRFQYQRMVEDMKVLYDKLLMEKRISVK
ncbi:D-inositol-3-phosphate glycosyltransferase [bioreactor metagenome]|uniref:D-inositol-3-phosphate glycosyltransferase n=1 Tax=bioreactor metagenome TaxID=1076179 RepID=A0A644Y4E3_9ZZZZ